MGNLAPMGTLQGQSGLQESAAVAQALNVLQQTADPRVYVRDEIIVDEAFVKRLQAIASGFAKGTTLKLAAREIRHTTGEVLRLEGYPLIVVADKYVGNNGAIDTSGTGGAKVAAGHKGSPGNAKGSKPGGTGGKGQPGLPGTSASSITLLAHSISNLSLIAKGGAGSNGGPGGQGGMGAEEFIFKDSVLPATNGGSGGAGGDGGDGGDAARIRIFTVQRRGLLTPLKLDGSGGLAGQAGPGGQPGTSFGVGPMPTVGKSGKKGAAGSPVTPEYKALGSAEWWAKARGFLGSARWLWANHRTRVGRYRWRVEDDTAAALVEFHAAVTLATHAEADRLRQYIEANVTPLGVSYDHDLKPDFSLFEEVITDYGPMVQSLTTVATSLLLDAADISNNKAKLGQELAHIEGLQSVQANEVASAQLGISHAQGELDLNSKRIGVVLNELEAVQKQMEDEQTADPFETIWAAATAVVAIVGAAYTGGATLIALPAALGLIVDSVSVLQSKIWDADAGEYNINGKSLSEWKDSKEFEEMVGGVQDLIDGAKSFYDKAQLVAELFEAEVDSDTAKRHKELVIQLAELDFQRRLLELKKLQAGLALESALQVKQVAEQDQQVIEQLVAYLSSDISILARLAGDLMRSAQVYVDLYTQYAFFAARALDLYTLKDHYAPAFSFALGYVHPDHEADALLLVDDGQPHQFVWLVAEYQNTVSTLPDPFLLKDAYDAYDQGLTTVQHQFWNFSDAETLNALRTTGQTAVRIPLSSVPSSRAELKLLQVYVSLTGAVGENETILVALEHTGDAENRRQGDTATVYLSAPPRRSIVAATVDESLLPPIGDQQFWGRSPTALWRLAIDPSETEVDLDGLTEIQLVADYRCVEGPTG